MGLNPKTEPRSRQEDSTKTWHRELHRRTLDILRVTLNMTSLSLQRDADRERALRAEEMLDAAREHAIHLRFELNVLLDRIEELEALG